MNKIAIEVEGLSKDFKTDFWKAKVRALHQASFSVRTGGIFGLIGPNGAGKTTTIKILMGLIRPTQGRAHVFGKPVSDTASKMQIGYLPENASYYDYLRAHEVLDFYGRLFGYSRKERKRRTDELLELVGLSSKRDIRLQGFSKGMLQRIGVAQAIVNDPQLLIFDEPMSGLDPIGRKDVRDIILGLRNQGKTILFSSHILSDVEALCDYVVILTKGQVRAQGSLGDLINPRVKAVEVVFETEGKMVSPQKWSGRVESRQSGSKLIVSTPESNLLPEIIGWGQEEGIELLTVARHKETLEDIFVQQMEETT